MPPVSPGQPSSFGSVYADSPGLLRENGYTFSFICQPDTANADLPICSGTAPTQVTDYQPVLAPLNPGDTLSIYGIQAISPAAANPLEFALKVGPHDATAATLLVGTSNKNGPWFQHFELPIQIEGPETGTLDVWWEVIDRGTVAPAPAYAYNRITLQGIIQRKV